MKGLIVDGFVDGSKMMVCPHQFEVCEYQSPVGDGAFCVCRFYDIHPDIDYCMKDENNERLEDASSHNTEALEFIDRLMEEFNSKNND